NCWAPWHTCSVACWALSFNWSAMPGCDWLSWPAVSSIRDIVGSFQMRLIFNAPANIDLGPVTKQRSFLEPVRGGLPDGEWAGSDHAVDAGLAAQVDAGGVGDFQAGGGCRSHPVEVAEPPQVGEADQQDPEKEEQIHQGRLADGEGIQARIAAGQ